MDMENRAYKSRNRKPDAFGQLPAWVVRLGFLNRLSGSELKVFNVIVAEADNDSHECWLRLMAISDASGVAERSIPAITEKLEVCGLIQKKDFGNRMKYIVQRFAPDWAGSNHWYSRIPRKKRLLIRDSQSGKFIGSYGSTSSETYGTSEPEDYGTGLESI